MMAARWSDSPQDNEERKHRGITPCGEVGPWMDTLCFKRVQLHDGGSWSYNCLLSTSELIKCISPHMEHLFLRQYKFCCAECLHVKSLVITRHLKPPEYPTSSALPHKVILTCRKPVTEVMKWGNGKCERCTQHIFQCSGVTGFIFFSSLSQLFKCTKRVLCSRR